MLGRSVKEEVTNNLYSKYYWVVPALYLSMDFLENIFIATIILSYPGRLAFIPSILGYISVAKRTGMALSLIVPILLLLSSKILKNKHGT